MDNVGVLDGANSDEEPTFFLPKVCTAFVAILLRSIWDENEAPDEKSRNGLES